jgi:2-phospho-L-lactate guanylyltransferase
MTLDVAIIVPIRSLSAGKRRLSSVLDAAGREELIRKMLQRVIHEAIEGAPNAVVLVVSPDPAALREASRVGSHVKPLHQDPQNPGLNPALAQATAEAVRNGASTLLVLPADLPLISATDIEHLLRRDAAVVVAPDRHGLGTNALMLRLGSFSEPFVYRFGAESYQKHLDEAHRLGLDAVTAISLGTSFDLDTPADLDRLDEMKPDVDRLMLGSNSRA